MVIKALIALWKRPEITRLCFEGVKRLEKFGVEPICIYSDKENEAIVKEYGFEGYYHENLPLGRKLNFGLKKALESEWDYFTQIGSDDLLRNELFEIYKPHFENKEKAFGITQVHFLNMFTGEVARAINSYPFGCGRMLHRSVFTDYKYRAKVRFTQTAAGKDFVTNKNEIALVNPEAANRFIRNGLAELVGFEEDKREIWTDSQNSTLDFDSEFRLTTKGIQVKKIDNDIPLILDLKTDVNIWPFSHSQFEIINEDVLKLFPEKDGIRKVRQVHYNRELHGSRE